MTAYFNLKSLGLAPFKISTRICSPIVRILMMVSHTVTLFMLLSLRHFIKASMTVSWGYWTMAPMQMQAEMRTFQKLSFSSSTSLAITFLLGLSQILESAQQAILLFLLSLSQRHLLISSIASKASGSPMSPNELMAASLISGFGLLRPLTSDLMT